jgi:hypothetical protein
MDSSLFGSFLTKICSENKAMLGCFTVMLRKSSFGDITMSSSRSCQDYALCLKLLKLANKAYVLIDVLTQYRILPDSISRNKLK